MTIVAPTSLSIIWVIVPAYNEARVVHSVLTEILSCGYQAVAVDDGSTDNTYEEAQRSGAHVCRHERNTGQGSALWTGIGYALSRDAEIIVTFDADGQHSAQDLARLVAPILTEDFDVVLGTKTFVDRQAAFFHSDNSASHR